jgi:hypothetical protein
MKSWRILRLILCPLTQRTVRSTPFSTTTSPLPDFYLHPRSMSTFSSTVLALREFFSFYLKNLHLTPLQVRPYTRLSSIPAHYRRPYSVPPSRGSASRSHPRALRSAPSPPRRSRISRSLGACRPLHRRASSKSQRPCFPADAYPLPCSLAHPGAKQRLDT